MEHQRYVQLQKHLQLLSNDPENHHSIFDADGLEINPAETLLEDWLWLHSEVRSLEAMQGWQRSFEDHIKEGTEPSDEQLKSFFEYVVSVRRNQSVIAGISE